MDRVEMHSDYRKSKIRRLKRLKKKMEREEKK